MGFDIENVNIIVLHKVRNPSIETYVWKPPYRPLVFVFVFVFQILSATGRAIFEPQTVRLQLLSTVCSLGPPVPTLNTWGNAFRSQGPG